jgi:hypothetical protein
MDFLLWTHQKEANIQMPILQDLENQKELFCMILW